MVETTTYKPARYPSNDTLECTAITILEYIIDQNLVKTDLKKRDKVPNIDGYFEIVEIDQSPIGKVEVQVKKLSDNNLEKPKYPCEIEFLKYCEYSVLPVLLILVDVDNEVAYWELCNNLLKKLSITKKQKTKTIRFTPEKNIKKGESGYIEEWKEIIADYKARIYLYEPLKEENQKLKEAYDLVLDKSDPLFGVEKAEFRNLHLFLDRLNHLYDTYFEKIKHLLYADYWKLGCAYSDYGEKHVTYMLYPIVQYKNDVQIKILSPKVQNQLTKRGLSYTVSSIFTENPFEAHPREYANEILKSKIEEIISKKRLLINNIYLTQEILFHFLDNYNEILGLERKNEYTTEEISDSIYLYFSIWLEEAVSRNYIRLKGNYYISLDSIPNILSKDTIAELNTVTKNRIENRYLHRNNFIIKSREYPLMFFSTLPTLINKFSIREFKRIYIPPDFGKLSKENNFIWSPYSPEGILYNITKFYENLPLVYDSIIDEFFPTIKQEMKFFSDFNKLIVVVDLTQKMIDGPMVEYYELLNEKSTVEEIDVYMKGKDNVPIDFKVNFKSDIIIENKKYKLIRKNGSVLRFIFDDFPMYNYVYSILLEKIKKVDIGELY